LERLSPVAKEIEAKQNNCSIKKLGHYYHTNGSGLGSELHIYSIVLCTAAEMGDVRLRTAGSWIYNDAEKCPTSPTTTTTPMSCYFAQAEPICPIDTTATAIEKFDMVYESRYTCPRITESAGGHSNVRAATTEYLFTRVSDIVQKEGERQLNLLFGSVHQNRPKNVPKNLITVHIRWGDKDGEMKLVPIQNYIDAVQQILEKRKAKRDTQRNQFNKGSATMKNVENGNGMNQKYDNEVHILLATEDPEAVKQFLSVKPKEWNVYIDQYYTEMLPYRIEFGNVFNVNSYYATHKNVRGRNGLIALGSLLVAIEANDFVLTTASNWSRLINELRKNIIDPRCNNCTTMIDLLYDEL
jgi:hypothetical protein